MYAYLDAAGITTEPGYYFTHELRHFVRQFSSRRPSFETDEFRNMTFRPPEFELADRGYVTAAETAPQHDAADAAADRRADTELSADD